MPIYHFNVVGDAPGDAVELDDLHEARCEAIKLTGEIFCDGSEVFWESRDWQLNVTNDAGLILFSLMLTAVDAPVLTGGGESL